MNIDGQNFALDTIEEEMINHSLINPTWGNMKSRRAWMQRVLDRLSYVPSDELEEFSQNVKRVLEAVEKREQQEISSFARIEYKHISGSHYAYLREWGSKQSYRSIGNAYFLPFRKYKLVNKQTKEVKFLSSLGLWRLEANKLYLLIQQAYPKQVLEKYLFCDFDLKYPADPKAPQILFKASFAKRYWEYEYLGEVDNFDELGINRNHVSFVTSLEVPLPKLEIKVSDVKEERKNLPKSSEADLDILSQSVGLAVPSNKSATIVENLRVWQALSRNPTVAQSFRLKTFWQRESSTFVLANMSDVHLVELDEVGHCLKVVNTQLLYISLYKVASSIQLTEIDSIQQKVIKKFLRVEQDLKNLNSEQFLRTLLFN